MNKLATLLALAVLSSCGSKKKSNDVSNTAPPKPKYSTQNLPPGLDLRLSNGKQGAPAFDRAKLAPATKLSEADANALLSRAKPLEAQAADYQSFALRASSQPPPRIGQTVTQTFPADPKTLLPPAATDANKELTVLRYMPEGEVPLAPELSVTFSQPMVAVTSQTDAAATTPVKLSPQPKGKWRWIGTRTILFDPEVRFPQATTYTVEIPATTKSATNNTIKAATKFTFETPAPTIVTRVPSDWEPQKLDVPVFVMFDQRIDAQAVLAQIKVTATGGNWGSESPPLKTRMLTAAEVDANKQMKATIEEAHKAEQDGRWLAFRTVDPLPTDAQITVRIPAGTPSAEGPNKTKTEQTFSFRTYPPLKLDEAVCNWSNDCRPGQPFLFRFNNPLDQDKFDDKLVSITPDIPGVKIFQQHSNIVINGFTKARTKYRVTIAKALTDDFGQTLARSETHDFDVGDAYPTFYGPQGMVVLDPSAAKPTLDFFSTNYDNLKVKLYQVQPSDYDTFARYMRDQWNHDRPPPAPGVKKLDTLLKTSQGKNELVETALDLSPVLKNGFGHAVAVVEPSPWKESYEPPRMIAWAQATKLGVDAHVDGDNLVAFVTELDSGKPAADVDLELRPYGVKGKSDAQGMATLELPVAKNLKGAHYLLAKRGDDVAMVVEHDGYWSEGGNWTKQSPGSAVAWYVIDDRKMYKPGEEVTLKGWLRSVDYGKNGDVGPVPGVTSVTFKVQDSQGVEIAKGTAPITGIGGFDAKFTLPKTPNLGYASIYFASTPLSSSYGHSFQIQEFRRPEFEVSAHASQGPFTVGEAGDVTVDAKYYSGGPLAGAQVNWYVTANQTSFTPPNRDEYIFGNWEPWWGYRRYWDDDNSNYRYQKPWSLEGKTDAIGSHTLHLDFLSVSPATPMSVVANASVMDVNRQAWSAASTLIVHPSSLYVGVKTKKPFVEKGQPFDVDVIAVDVEGKVAPGAAVDLKAVRLDWEYKKGRYTTKEVDPQACHVTAGKDPKPCSFQTTQGGTYQLTATIVDAQGRPNETKLTFWVTGGDEPPSREVKQELVQIIPDRKEYSAGNTAELLVQAPFYPAEGVVTWRRGGIVKVERITMTGPSTVLAVPITDAMVPNLGVHVDLVGMAVRTNDVGDPDPKLPKRPAYAVGAIDLSIPPKQRTLAVSVAPNAEKLAPGEQAKISIEVRDAAGKPVPDAETAVIVVDEAILSLSGYQFPNPVDSFYPHRYDVVRDAYLRAYVKLANPQRGVAPTTPPADALPASGALAAPEPEKSGLIMAEAKLEEKPAKKEMSRRNRADESKLAKDKNAQSDREGDDGNSGQAIAIRTNFNPLAAFSPSVKTDASGKATVDIKLPDNLTRYRIVAVSVAGDKFYGKGESSLIARLPLMVRPSPPRFLNFGDTFKLPVVIQNQTDSPITVKVALRTSNATITDGAGRQLSVPPNDRVEVQFPAAAELAGTARFQVVTSAGSFSDAAELAIPVWTPATTEAFATYGVIDEGAVAQPVALPGKVVTQFGGLEITTASTNLQALTDAVLYLVQYPFECAEQRSSRILAIAALRDVLAAFKTKDLPSAAAMEKSVATDIEHLSQMQNYDGGYAFWDRGYPSDPYLTVFVTHALAKAKQKGFTVPQQMLDNAKPYLREIEAHYPWFYPKEVRWAVSAYTLYVRKQLGDTDIAKGQRLYREAGLDNMTLETAGWLLGLFARNGAAASERAAIVRHALNKVSETSGAANFTTSYGDGNYLLLASDRRVDGVMLESLIQEQKNLDLIPKLVTGLLAHRKAGRWLNTQENAFVLLALDLYFRTYENKTPDFVARVWLGNDYAGEHAFKGRTTEYHQVAVPMKDVATHDKQNLTIQKDGVGRLYYRVGMKYAPADLKIDPADYGFVVERTYEGADDPKDVTRSADGVWHIKAGARVRVKLKLVNENRRYHVALVDPLPAGLEAMNPELAVTGPIPTDPNEQKSRGAYWWWYGPWYEHQNMRDERTEAFAALLWEGVHDYQYVARATTPGNFVVPPPKAEEMYMPETFGRGGSDRVIVE